jgi:hypothetical protein
MEGVKDLVNVLKSSNGNVALGNAVKTVLELGKVGENKLKLVNEDGLIGGLVRVMKKGYGYKGARENAVVAIHNIAYGADDEVKAGLFLFPQLISRIEAIIGDANLIGTETRNVALKLKKEIEDMGGGGQSNPPSTQSLTQSFGSSTAGSVRIKKVLVPTLAVMRTEQAVSVTVMRSEQATMKSNLETVRTGQTTMRSEQAAMRTEQAPMRTEQATMKSNLETVCTELAAMRSEQVAMKSSLTSVQDSLFRVEKALATLTSTLAPTEILDLSHDLDDISTTLSNPPPPTASTGNNKRSNLAILADNQASFYHTLKKVKKEKDDALEALEDAEACIVCMAEKRGVLFLPCGHLVCCGGCSEIVDDCPMCMKVIGSRKTVFM